MFKSIHCRKLFLNGSHGGAWKVAYADFVTGMMSLFLVLWILSQDEEVIIATTRFFRDPYKAGVPKSTPVEQKDARPGSMVDQIVGRSDTTMRNTDDTTSIDIDVLHRIAQDWFERLKLHEIDDSTMQIEATSEGLKVTLFYKCKGGFIFYLTVPAKVQVPPIAIQHPYCSARHPKIMGHLC